MLEARVQPRVRFVELHVAQRNAGEHEVGRAKLRILRQRLARQPLRVVEVERLRELHVRQPYVRFGVIRRLFQDFVNHLLGVPGIVLFEEQLGAPEQRLGVAFERALGLVESVVGVLRAAQQVRGAADHAPGPCRRSGESARRCSPRSPSSAGRWRGLRLPCSSSTSPSKQPRTARLGILFERAQRRFGFLELSLPAQRFGLDHSGLERLGRAERFGLARGRNCSVVAAGRSAAPRPSRSTRARAAAATAAARKWASACA